MADELDDRLRDLASDAEPLVVLAGPQAARRHGERRRARRRAAAAGAAAALALTVGGWQLLPRLQDGPDTAAAPAASATRATGQAPTALQERVGAELLPAGSLPYADKWQWTVVSPAEVAKFPLPCGMVPLSGARAEASRTYLARNISAVANYRLYALDDDDAAASRSDALRRQMQTACGIGLPTGGKPSAYSDRAERFSGTSKLQPGVAVWMESEGPYVAVLFLTTPSGDSQSLLQSTGVEKCIAASLGRLVAPGAPRSPHAGSGESENAGKNAVPGKDTGSGGVPSPDNC
ncbi:hypothetical protein [Streptomyces sp. NPDC049040]|uniref:hypothetical protein n=1 Tax=Streptomyces sp. NPDC049040 TaxID=3365593 RepID=UPI003710C75F